MPIGSDTFAWRGDLPHLQKPDRTYFITFVTRHRRALSTGSRDAVFRTCLEGHLRSYGLYALVVMPDHVHLIATPYPHVNLPTMMKYVKSASARLIGGGIVWESEYFDRVIRRHEDLRDKGEYIVNNPVRAGLVAVADDYPWIWRSWIEGVRR